jgi:hypothetical protein
MWALWRRYKPEDIESKCSTWYRAQVPATGAPFLRGSGYSDSWPADSSRAGARVPHMRCSKDAPPYSKRRALRGSIFDARRAGIQHAHAATASSRIATPAMVMGSRAVTP